MKTLMSKIMLTCRKATFFSAVKNVKKLGRIQRLQLMIHLMACPHCREFDRQSDAIDKTLEKLYTPDSNGSEEHLSDDKKTVIQENINREK